MDDDIAADAEEPLADGETDALSARGDESAFTEKFRMHGLRGGELETLGGRGGVRKAVGGKGAGER
ncbi:MAG: hypothetical protein RL077_1617 [Verrucomicrobiota bacterium]